MTVATFNELIALAVQREREASKLYELAAQKTSDQRGRELLSELALEENEHCNMFAGIKPDKSSFPSFTVPKDSSLSTCFVPLEYHDGMSFAEIIIYAIQKEDQSYQFYRDLARSNIPPEFVSLINYLAGIELTHKRKLEEYFSAEVDAVI